MVIFHCYVSLPEGKGFIFWLVVDLPTPSFKMMDNSSVGMDGNSQHDGKVIQNSMVTTNQPLNPIKQAFW